MSFGEDLVIVTAYLTPSTYHLELRGCLRLPTNGEMEAMLHVV